jgi:hypothetical protein
MNSYFTRSEEHYVHKEDISISFFPYHLIYDDDNAKHVIQNTHTHEGHDAQAYGSIPVSPFAIDEQLAILHIVCKKRTISITEECRVVLHT